MIVSRIESRTGYDLAQVRPWFEPTAYDWIWEVIAVLLLAFGALVVVL